MAAILYASKQMWEMKNIKLVCCACAGDLKNEQEKLEGLKSFIKWTHNLLLVKQAGEWIISFYSLDTTNLLFSC